VPSLLFRYCNEIAVILGSPRPANFLLAKLSPLGRSLAPGRGKRRSRRSDCQALIALWEQPYPWRDEVLPLLESYPFPCLLYVGEAEWNYKGMKVCAAGMPRAQFVALPNYGHFDIFAYPTSIIPHVKSFLEQSAG
jgi:pimeloyl-ACP methyl ester carboxylesterase